MSSIVQFTLIVSISISPCIKIHADTVGHHITQVFAEPGNCNFHGANCVVYEAFAVKCFLRPKLQTATLVCDADVFEMAIIYIIRNVIAYDDMFRISENLVGDISSSIVLDLNVFLRLFYFHKKRDIQTLDSVSGVIMRVCKHGKNSLLLN